MLCLGRRVGESIIIGAGDDEVTITILGVKGNQVKIGCSGAPHISIDRSEIRERKERENERS